MFIGLGRSFGPILLVSLIQHATTFLCTYFYESSPEHKFLKGIGPKLYAILNNPTVAEDVGISK